MAAFQKFNAFAAAMPNGNVNLGADTLKLMLTNTAPVAANVQYSDISATELANGNGYTTGGAAVTIAGSTQTAGTYKLACTTPVVTTATGALGPFRYAVLYDTTPTTKSLIGFWDYGSALTLASGDTFTVTFDAANGIFQLA
ncbi:MAG TPA: hypothetical protein VGV37_06465 [Aliidongia sp.]|uniref:hypothetical protein n=1 Tax=Aliidongia sp. TaxID=1914230 RepID=UPI002DDD195A|nr:hypothetical protein [Aliidongia sp.]HEV2674169.1 hypothetical protein [Aliidongia sp.]